MRLHRELDRSGGGARPAQPRRLHRNGRSGGQADGLSRPFEVQRQAHALERRRGRQRGDEFTVTHAEYERRGIGGHIDVSARRRPDHEHEGPVMRRHLEVPQHARRARCGRFVPLAHRRRAHAVIQHRRRAREFDAFETPHRHRQRTAPHIAKMRRRARIGPQRLGIGADAREHGRAEDHRARGPRVLAAHLAPRVLIGNLRHGGRRDRGAARRDPPDRGHPQQFLIEEHAVARGQREQNPAHHKIVPRAFSLHGLVQLRRREDFHLRAEKRLLRLEKRPDRRPGRLRR